MRGLLLIALLGWAAPSRAALFKPKDSRAADALRPLSAREISAAVSVVRQAGVFGSSATFALVALSEPVKNETADGRRAKLVVVDQERKETSEAVVDLSSGRLTSWRLLFDVASARAAFIAPAPPAAEPRAKAKKDKAASELSLDGHRARWDKWTFRIFAHPREGLVLSEAAFDGRSVLHRASASEIARLTSANSGEAVSVTLVEGEEGFGRRARPLEPRVDAPADASYVDAVFADDAGAPFTVPRAIALFPRRSLGAGREAVARLTVASGGREYSQLWIFKQDGELEGRVEVVGSTSAAEGHFFSYRLDLDVDGSTNALSELSLPEGLKSAALRGAPLRTALEARRDAAPALARRWLMRSASGSGGYALVPAQSAPVPPAELKRAAFLSNGFWALPYRPERLYAAGEHPSSDRAEGLERWASEDEPLDGRDLVLWHSFGVLTAPGRAAAAASAGFRLAPSGPTPDPS